MLALPNSSALPSLGQDLVAWPICKEVCTGSLWLVASARQADLYHSRAVTAESYDSMPLVSRDACASVVADLYQTAAAHLL